MAEPTPRERRTQAAIARRLADVGFALPGTLIERHIRCGKPTCRCAEEPPRLHGPYRQWTRKVDGKTLTVNLTSEQIARYGSWFTNAQTLRSLLTELEDLSLRVARRAEGWT
jgi:hypothetical protein